MKNSILMVGYGNKKLGEMQQECLRYGVFIHILENTSQALCEISKRSDYLLIVIFPDDSNYLKDLSMIREYTKAPILVITAQYKGAEKIAAIKAGADEYIQQPETLSEEIASFHALIRRFMELNSKTPTKPLILSRGCVLIILNYRKVYINGHEIDLPRREFDLFCMLVSEPERIFTYEQIFTKVWKGDYIPTDNSLHSCINRIRRKLEDIPQVPCTIVNTRGVGYSFKLNQNKL